MRNMIVADIFNGNGVTVIDPHGSLVEDLLESDSKESHQRCHLFQSG